MAVSKESQQFSTLAIASVLGADALKITAISYDEGISQPFRLQASCFTNQLQVARDALIDKPAVCTLKMTINGAIQERHFHGIVAAVSSGGNRLPSDAEGDQFQDIELSIKPRLDWLRQRSNCRIFQGKTVVDIVTALFGEHQVAFRNALTGSYPPREYCVQYQESDYEFVHRLLEAEGIFYFFEHSKGAHTLVLADSTSVYQPCLEEQVACFRGDLAEAHITDWHGQTRITPGKSSQRGYNFRQPTKVPAANKADAPLGGSQPALEVYEYVAESTWISRPAQRAAAALDGMQRDMVLAGGMANCRSFMIGRYFTFKRHDDKREEGKSYLLVRVGLAVSQHNQLGAKQAEGQEISCNFDCVPKSVIYRAASQSPRPRISGVQTAVVTGGKGDEIHVDAFGRIKVQFHWDRGGQLDEHSSCWVRVAQNWAGNKWGAFFYPRVGQEVVVEFLEGDPDQPLIIGAVYNGDLMPPYDLPANKTQSGFKSHSSKGGSAANFNELRFEDEKGKELLALQAEKDHELLVKNDQRDQVKHDRITKVDNNDSLKVGKKLLVDVGQEITIQTGAASITMKSDGTIAIKGTQIEIKGTTIALKAAKISLN